MPICPILSEHCFVKLQNRRNLRQMSRANLTSPLQERTVCQRQNAHDPIVSRETFNRVQEEMSRRKTYMPQSKKNAITASEKYSRYALSDVLQCGECGTRYKRVTWNIRGKKRIVWLCVSRLDYGTKFCKDSITVDEIALQKNNRKGTKEIQCRRRSHLPYADEINHRWCHRTQWWLGWDRLAWKKNRCT